MLTVKATLDITLTIFTDDNKVLGKTLQMTEKNRVSLIC